MKRDAERTYSFPQGPIGRRNVYLLEDVQDLEDEPVAEWTGAAAYPQLARARPAEGVAAGNEGRASVTHHANAA